MTEATSGAHYANSLAWRIPEMNLCHSHERRISSGRVVAHPL